MEFLYLDSAVAVCVKPAGVLSTDEPGGLPELVRRALGDETACVRTVHRLDRVAGGLMVLARTPEAASALSAQIRAGSVGKEYLAVVHGAPVPPAGTYTDLLLRDKAERKTYVTREPGRGVQQAVLDYETRGTAEGLSLVHIGLRTGRTHQIRCQFAARGLPLAGERKYDTREDGCPLALWSCRLAFVHPVTGEDREFTAPPPESWPWTLFPAKG